MSQKQTWVTTCLCTASRTTTLLHSHGQGLSSCYSRKVGVPWFAHPTSFIDLQSFLALDLDERDYKDIHANFECCCSSHRMRSKSTELNLSDTYFLINPWNKHTEFYLEDFSRMCFNVIFIGKASNVGCVNLQNTRSSVTLWVSVVHKDSH